MKKPHPLESKPWKKPTAKLPRARVMFTEADYSAFNAHGCNPVAVLPCHTAAQARQICKAAPFLQLSEGEKVERLAEVIDGGAFYESPNARRAHCSPYPVEYCQEVARNKARAVLRAMGGGK